MLNDPMPTESFIEVGSINVSGDYSFRNLRRLLELEGQLRGFDAIIYIQESRAMNYCGGCSEFNLISGTGIKFIYNIDYADHLVKGQEIFLYSEELEDYESMAITSFNILGEVDSISGDLDLENFIYKLSLDHTISIINNSSKYLKLFNEHRMIIGLTFHEQGQTIQKYQLKYDDNQRPEYVKMRTKWPVEDYKVIHFLYSEGKLTLRDILHNGNQLIQTYEYNQKGILSNTAITMNGLPFVKIDYYYFDDIDLKEVLVDIDLNSSH